MMSQSVSTQNQDNLSSKFSLCKEVVPDKLFSYMLLKNIWNSQDTAVKKLLQDTFIEFSERKRMLA